MNCFAFLSADVHGDIVGRRLFDDPAAEQQAGLREPE